MRVNVGHVFCETFNRDVFVRFSCRNYNSFPGSQARITRFRLTERFCIESSNKRSDRGSLQEGIHNYLLRVFSERRYRNFCLGAFPLFPRNRKMGPHKSISLALGASHQLNPALGILKEFMCDRAMLIPEMSPNHSLTKFVLNGEIYRMTLFCFCASTTSMLYRLFSLFLLCNEPLDML